MEDDKHINIFEDLGNDLALEEKVELNEDAILVILVKRVSYLLEHDKDLLMSYLYRLDIPQRQIMNVLKVTNIIPAEQSLARLILNRQIERVRTKKKYKQDPIDGWEY